MAQLQAFWGILITEIRRSDYKILPLVYKVCGFVKNEVKFTGISGFLRSPDKVIKPKRMKIRPLKNNYPYPAEVIRKNQVLTNSIIVKMKNPTICFSEPFYIGPILAFPPDLRLTISILAESLSKSGQEKNTTPSDGSFNASSRHWLNSSAVKGLFI
jgi:hypothetical protein